MNGSLDDSTVTPTAESRRQTVLIALGAFAIFALAVGGLIAAVALPSLLRARAAAAESTAATTLRVLASAEETYKTLNGRYASFGQLADANLVDRKWLDSRDRDGYRFDVAIVADGEGFEARADPLEPESRRRHLFVASTDLVVRVSADGPAGAESPPFEPE